MEISGLIIDDAIVKKLKDRGITPQHVVECFENRSARFLEELRLRHKTNPPTYWFISTTNKKRVLKVCFIPTSGGNKIKSSFEPNETELRIYKDHA